MENAPHVSTAADDARLVAGEYYTGLWNHHDQRTCEVWLANAPESILDQLQAMHPAVYVTHNDAPRSLGAIKQAIEQVDVLALKESGITIHQIGPTHDGRVRVAVLRDAARAQARLDEMLGPNVASVHEGPRAQALPLRCGNAQELHSGRQAND